MNEINIAPSKATPGVAFDAATRTLEFTGESYPEDSIPFYKDIQRRLETYLQENHEPLTVNFKLHYFNTSSSKCLFDILESMEKSHAQYKNIKINWYYEEGDEDIFESGEDFSLDIKLPFELVQVKR